VVFEPPYVLEHNIFWYTEIDSQQNH